MSDSANTDTDFLTSVKSCERIDNHKAMREESSCGPEAIPFNIGMTGDDSKAHGQVLVVPVVPRLQCWAHGRPKQQFLAYFFRQEESSTHSALTTAWNIPNEKNGWCDSGRFFTSKIWCNLWLGSMAKLETKWRKIIFKQFWTFLQGTYLKKCLCVQYQASSSLGQDLCFLQISHIYCMDEKNNWIKDSACIRVINSVILCLHGQLSLAFQFFRILLK